MACENKKTRRLSVIILCLMFCGLPLVAPRNIDCKGKPFHCVNSTNFIICVDLGGGISSTVDDVIIPCPESTICDINNYFECEFPPPTTLTLPIQPSDVSNESGLGKNKVITKVSWENIEITTTSPMQKTSERSEKYLNNVSITNPEEFTTTKAKLEAIIDNNQSTTIQQDNINGKYENYSNEKQFQQFTGNSMMDESRNLNVSQSDINKDENTNGSKLNSYTIDARPTQSNEELKDRRLSSVGTGTESTPSQSSISPPDTTEFYSYTSDNRDVITFDSSFTTNSEMPTSDIMSVNTPISSNSRSKNSQVLKSVKETTPYAVTAGTITESKKTITVEPKGITLSYNSSNSSSQINNDNNSPAVNLVNEYQSFNSSNDTDNTSHLNEFSVTESLSNITPGVSEKYLQNNSTQDHLSSIVYKPLESEQVSNTMDKYEPKITTNETGDITTRPNITEVQKGSANQENTDLSASNSINRTNQLMYTTDKQALTESINSSYIKVSDNNKDMSNMVKNLHNLQETDKITINQSNPPNTYTLKTVQEILPATDASIFAIHEQDRVGDQIKENVTKKKNYDETTVRDLNTNYYVTDSYRVNDNLSISTFDETNFNKNGYNQSEVTYNNTTNTYRIDEVIATTPAKNNEIIAIAMHNNTETTRANQSKTTGEYISKIFQDNSSAVISTLYNHNGTAISDYDSKNVVVNSDNITHQQSLQKILEQSNFTTNYGSNYEHTLKNSNDSFGSHKVIIFKNEDKIKTSISKTHEQVAVENETQKRISIPNIYNETTISNLSNNYVNENTYSNNQYKSTQAISELNSTRSDDLKNENTTKNSKNGLVDDKSIFTTIEPNMDVQTTDLDNKFQNNKEIAIKKLSNSAIDDFKNKGLYNDVSSGFENYEVIVTTMKPNNQMIKTALSYDLKINIEEANNNLSRTQEKSTDMYQIQKNNATSFIHGEQAIIDLNNNNYAKEGSSIKNQYQSTQTINSGNDEVLVTTAESNIDILTTTVSNYNSQKNKNEIKNISKTHEEGVVKHEQPKNITTLFIHNEKAMTDSKIYAEKHNSSKNEYQSTQTTNSGNDEVIVTTTELNIEMITTTLPNYNFQSNKENTTNNVLETHEKGAFMHETQKDITKIFILGGKAIEDLNNKTYAKEDSSSKNQYQSTQTTNTGNEVVVVTTTDPNIDVISKIASNYALKINKEYTTKNISKIREEGVVKHEKPKNITKLFIPDGKGTTDLNNENYVLKDSSNKNEYQYTQTTNSGNNEVVVTTTQLNIGMITTILPNYNFQNNKEDTTNNVLETHGKGAVMHETQKDITTIYIHGGKAMADLNNKTYAKEDISSKNQYTSTQTTNTGNDVVVVTTTDPNINMITKIVSTNDLKINKEETTKKLTKTHEEGVVKHETPKNITTLLNHDGKGRTDLINKNYVQKDSSNKNEYQYTQTTNSGNDEVVVTTTELNIGMITTTLPNHNFQNNKEDITNNVLEKHGKGAVMHETQKDTTTIFIHGGKAMADLNNKTYAKEDSSSKNQYKSTQTTNTGNDVVVVTTTDPNINMITKIVSTNDLKINKEETTKKFTKTHEEGVVKHETPKNITTLLNHDGKGRTDLINKNYVQKDSSNKNEYQYTQTTNSGNDEVVVTTTELNIGMITTTLPNHNFQNNKEDITNNVLEKHGKGAVIHETQKDTTTIFIHGGKAISDLNNKTYDKEDSSSKNRYQSTQTTNTGNDVVVVTTTDSNFDMITKIVSTYDLKINKEETTKNISKLREEGVVKNDKSKNITKLFIPDGKGMTDLNNKNYVQKDSSNKNEYQYTQTTNSGNDEVVVTTTEFNIGMITTTLPNHNFQNNKEDTTNNVLETHGKGAVMHETQKDTTTIFLHGGKAMADLNNKTYAKEDSSIKNQYTSTQTTNTGNDVVVVTTTDPNINMITKIVSTNDLKINKEETTKKFTKTHEEGVVKHETPKNITTLLNHDGKAMSDLSNKSFAKEDSSSKNQFQSKQTVNFRNDEVKVTTTDSNTEMITTTVPNYNSQKNKEETLKNISKTHEEAVVRQVTQKNITTIFIHDGKVMADLNIKNYVKEESSSKNQYQSTQTNSGNDEVVVTTADSNIDMKTKIVPNYDLKKNKELTTKNTSQTHEEGVIKHEALKNITTLLIHDRKAMSNLNYKSYAKEDSNSTNQFQSIQTMNPGIDEVKVTTIDSNIEMITTTVPNYNSQKNKEETTKNMLKTHEQSVVRQEVPKNITAIFIHSEKAMADLNKKYVKEDSSKNQFQSKQTTNSGNHEVIVTTTESNITTATNHSGKVMSDLNNKSFVRDKDSKIQYQSTLTSNQFTKNGVLKEELPFTFNNSTNSFEADKIIIKEDNTTKTTDAPDFMVTKVDDSGLTNNLNHYTDTFVSTYGNIYVTKSNIDTDRSAISDRLTTTTHKNLQKTESTNINGEMTATHITNNLTFEPTSAPINEFKISSKTKSNKVEGTITANRDFAKTFSDGKIEKNDRPLSIIGQEISSRTNRQAEKQMDIFKLGGNRTTNNYNITTIIASEYPQNSSKKHGENLTAPRVPEHADVKLLTTISEDLNSYTHKEIGITEKKTILPVINSKDLTTTVAEDFLTTVTTASYNHKKTKSPTSISKESVRGITNGRETTVSSSSIRNMSTNTPQYDETKVVESKPLQISLLHSLNIKADATIPSSEADKVTSVLNRAVNTRDVTLLKQNSQTENYQSTEGTVISLINLTSPSPYPLNNTILDTSVKKTSVETERVTDILNNQPQQIKKTEVSSKSYFNKTHENKPNIGIIKSIRSRDTTDSKASTTSKASRINEKFRNESVLNINQQTDIIPSELSMKIETNTGLHASTTEQNIAQMISKHFTDIKQNSNIFRKTTPTYYVSSTISSLELSDRSITTAKIKINRASTIRNTNDMSDATLVTESTINKRKKKSKTYDIGKETLVENLQESDGNISSTTSNKNKDFSNISNSNMTINADEPSKKHYLISTTLASGMMTQSPMNINTKPLTMMEKTEKEYLDNRSKKLNKNFEITSESTPSVNSNYTTVGHDPQSISKYYTNSTTRGSIKTTMKNTTTMTKLIRDVNAKSRNTAPTNVIVILFDYGTQTQKKEGKSASNYTNTEENPDDNINVEPSSHNRYENTDPNDIIVEPVKNSNNADNDNDLHNSPTSKVDVRVNDTDMVLCGRYNRGRYPDKNDCRKFYVCVGRKPPIKGICPNNTVYSELRKQCTRNLSHCVRNNKFKCLTEGRFSDFLKDEIYHVCIKNRLGAFVMYRFQCQNGFRLDKKTVKCIKETENSSRSMSSASESSKSKNKSTTEKTSTVTNKFECQEEGKFADTRDCRTYYVCSKKRNRYRRKKKKCESDERFDRDKKKCVDAESYECDI